MVSFNNGNTNWNDQDNDNYVRPVRQHFRSSLALKAMTEIFTIEKLYQAYTDCRRRKKNTASALKFELDREKNIVALLQELKSKRYEVSQHICFIVKDPTPREVFAANFRDRVVHHLIYNELRELFERDFFENSFANRVDKGTHKGMQQLRTYIQEDREAWYLKLDIKSFFRSINKDILFRLVESKIADTNKSIVWKKEVLWLVSKIIYHDPTKNYNFHGDSKTRQLIPAEKSLFYAKGKGLPIGNLTSQFFANIYLNELDQFVVRRGHKKYVRYVDDFVIVGPKEIYREMEVIVEFLKESLALEISEKKIRFQQVKKGIDFLGYYVKPGYTLVRRKIVKRFKQKIRQAGSEISLETINSYYGHFQHANSYRLRQKIYQTYFKRKFKAKSNYYSIKNNTSTQKK